jgi:hypothetical protein
LTLNRRHFIRLHVQRPSMVVLSFALSTPVLQVRLDGLRMRSIGVGARRDMGDPEKERMREVHDVTPTGYAMRFQEPGFVNGQAIAAIAERGGTE